MPQHKSIFRYNVTKPYPFVWFTPAVAVGFVLAMALFSFLNFTVNGYYLTNEVSSNPNATLSQQTWLHKMPSFMTSKVKAVCQPALLVPQDTFFTNQTALLYTIVSLTSTQNQDVLSSLEYYNNVIEQCGVTNIDIDVASSDRLPTQIGFMPWGAVVRTYLSCNVSTRQGNVQMNLIQTYDYVPEGTSLRKIGVFLGSEFLKRDEVSKGALWWGESLMSWYWFRLSLGMWSNAVTDTAYNHSEVRKGVVSFARTNRTNDPASLDFFDVNYRYLSVDGYITFPGNYSRIKRVAQLDALKAYPNVWILADGLAKSTYFSVLTDLGQWRSNGGISQQKDGQQNSETNILTDATLLQYFSANISKFKQFPQTAQVLPGPVDTPFELTDDRFRSQSFNTTASTISASYLCQVPRIKSAGNVFVSVLVADLVFLQAFWTVFRLIVDTWMLRSQERRSPETTTAYDELASTVQDFHGEVVHHSNNLTQGVGSGTFYREKPTFRHAESG